MTRLYTRAVSWLTHARYAPTKRSTAQGLGVLLVVSMALSVAVNGRPS